MLLLNRTPAAVPLVLALVLAAGSSAETLIPAPGQPSAGYYVQYNDQNATVPGPAAATMAGVWQPGEPAAPAGMATSAMIPPTAVVPASGVSGCSDCTQLWAGACDAPGSCATGDCGSINCGSRCDLPCGLWAHYSSIYGSLLYLRPRNAEVAYAVPIDGPITAPPGNNPLQIGSIGVVDPDFETGFSGGVNLAVNTKTSIFAELMMLDSSTTDEIAAAAPDVVRSIVSHPSSTSAATDFLSASSQLDIDFETIDVGIRHLFVGGQVFAVNYLVGARYSNLNQEFGAVFVDNGTENVATDIDFDGGGLRLGLDAERQSCNSRLRLYTRGSASFLAGRFRGSYFQGQSFDPSVVTTDWEAGRVVPVLDLELGAGWSSPNGCWRFNAGYLVSAWYNTVLTNDLIEAVQLNDFNHLGDTLTFDGLRASAEWRF